VLLVLLVRVDWAARLARFGKRRSGDRRRGAK
jgi:hypothetical protein